VSNIEQRLYDCAELVAPEVDATLFRSSEFSNIEGWDSLKTVTLVTVVEEEFEIEVPFERLADITSCRSLLSILEEQL
jgi:acyl carrier protein